MGFLARSAFFGMRFPKRSHFDADRRFSVKTVQSDTAFFFLLSIEFPAFLVYNLRKPFIFVKLENLFCAYFTSNSQYLLAIQGGKI